MKDVFCRYGIYKTEFDTNIKNLNVYEDLYVIETESCFAIDRLEKINDYYKPKNLPYLIIKNPNSVY
jgi:hypothetical protein